MRINRLAIPFCFLCGLTVQAPAQTFSTLAHLGSFDSGIVPTAVPGGDIYGTGSGGFFRLKPKTGGGWKLTGLGVPGGSSAAVLAPRGGFYVAESGNPSFNNGFIYLISPPAAPERGGPNPQYIHSPAPRTALNRSGT